MMPSPGERWYYEQQQRLMHHVRQQAAIRTRQAAARVRQTAQIRIMQHSYAAEEGPQVSYTESRHKLGEISFDRANHPTLDLSGSFGDAASLIVDVTYDTITGFDMTPTLWCWLEGTMSDSDRWLRIGHLENNAYFLSSSPFHARAQYVAPFLPKLRLRLAIKRTNQLNDIYGLGSASGVEVCVGTVKF